MNNGGDAAEQVVRLSLEGFEVAAKLTGTAAKELTVLLISVLKQEQKTKGKARLTNMLKSGKELKVFSIPNKDLKTFTEQAKKYGVLYCVLKDKYNKDGNVPIDIIARAEDASKIQRIFDRFELGNVDKGSIVANAEKSIAEREERVDEVPTKTRGERIVEEAMGDPVKKEGQSHENPTAAFRKMTGVKARATLYRTKRRFYLHTLSGIISRIRNFSRMTDFRVRPSTDRVLFKWRTWWSRAW